MLNFVSLSTLNSFAASNPVTIPTNSTAPTIGEGIFLIKDVARILRLDYGNVRRWILGFWDGHFKETFNYSFGEQGRKAVNFYTLIEFYTFYKLREKDVSAQELRKVHKHMSNELNTPYPFAIAAGFFIEKRGQKAQVWYKYLESLIRADGKGQISLPVIIEPFLEQIEFDENNLAMRYFPVAGSKNVVVDPKHQLGQPTILGTNIKTQAIFNLYKGGEPLANIAKQFDLRLDEVQDALAFHQKAVA